MSDKQSLNLPAKYTTIQGDKALEMVMRDVLEGMQEFATMSNFSPRSIGGYEILSIEEPNAENMAVKDSPATEKAEVIPLKTGRGCAA